MNSAEYANFYVGQKVRLILKNYKKLQKYFGEDEETVVEIIRIFFEEPLFEVFVECPDGITFFRKEVFSQDLLPLDTEGGCC